MRKKDDEKQKCIKDAVVQTILREGFHGASVAKIAKAAGVSPATVYIYYENKDAMLRDIYEEYSENTMLHLLHNLSDSMTGEEIIAGIIRQYYYFIVENQEIYHFIEQFSSCPALYSTCNERQELINLNRLLAELKKKKVLKNFNNDNLSAMLFYPVKSIAEKNCGSKESVASRLDELIYIIQKALLY